MNDRSDRMTTPWGEHVPARFPEDPRDRLRAWDASDEYLLGHLAEQDVPLSGTVVVVGDRWGALVTALAAHRPVQITDSYLTREATRANLERAGVEPGSVRLADHAGPAAGPCRRAAGAGAEEPGAAGGPAAAAGARPCTRARSSSAPEWSRRSTPRR
ncbi:hypothetical protein LV779_01805 [Streptomyces thinghirensis]|nr:hypothetical protein [Streptomyces thinghirensis]